MPRKNKKQEEKKVPMKNITINLPNIYDKNIQWLISKRLIASRSEAIRTALRDFLEQEYNQNLELLGFKKVSKQMVSVDSTDQFKATSTKNKELEE